MIKEKLRLKPPPGIDSRRAMEARQHNSMKQQEEEEKARLLIGFGADKSSSKKSIFSRRK